MDKDAYPVHPRSKINRLAKRGTYEYERIHRIVNTAPILQVAFTPADPAEDPFPTILPMIGCMASYDEPDMALGAGPLDLYLHGSATARMQDLAAAEGGLPVAVCATHVDGYVLALTPFSNSYNYRSAVLHGYAVPVTDQDERMWALTRITDEVLPGRWDASRVPPTSSENKQTGVLRVRVESASAKTRAASLAKADRKDERSEDVRGKVWTGVVPAWTQFGEPVPDEWNAVEDVPAYMDGWRLQGNDQRQNYAVEVAGLPYK